MPSTTFNKHSTAEEVATTLKDSIQGKNVLIVGASVNSLGGEFFRVIVPHAATIWVAGRTKGRLQAAVDDALVNISGSKPIVHLVELDMASFTSIKSACAMVNSQELPIDVLVQNIMMSQSPELRRTEDGFESQIGGNHFGTFLLVSLLLPRIRQAGPGARIVTVASEAHAWQPFRWDDPNFKLRPEEYNSSLAYGHSKYANVAFTKELAKRFAKEEILAFTLHPGRILTNGVEALSKETWLSYGATYTEDGVRVIPDSVGLKSIPQGAATYVVAAFDRSISDQSGSYLADCQVHNELVSPYITDENTARLWSLTEELTGVHFFE